MLASMVAWGQGNGGGLLGDVTDSGGAHIPNAVVSITDEATKVTLTTKTNADGAYSFPALTPSRYTVVIKSQGFETFTEHGIVVDVDNTSRADVTMKVGSSEQQVVVFADTQRVETSSASLGLVVEEKSINDLPLAYGNAFALEVLAPGVTLDNLGTQHVYDSGTANISVNGSALNTIDYKLDGVADNRLRSSAFSPNTESINQYRFGTSTYDASQGHAAGGFINVQAKSGTDKIHGSLFTYYQNPNINSASWSLNPVANPPKPSWIRFGFGVGGPILRQKAFYFVGYEHSYAKNPPSSSSNDVIPTHSEIQGDFSSLLALDPKAAAAAPCTTSGIITGTPNIYQLFDPWSSVGSGGKNYRKCIPGNRVDQYTTVAGTHGVNPIAAKVLNYYDVHTTGATGASDLYNYAILSRDKYDGGIIRLDYNLNSSQSMFLHVERSARTNPSADPYPPTNGRTLRYNNYGAALGHTYALSPSTVLTSVAGYTRFTNFATNDGAGSVTPTSIGMPSYLDTGTASEAIPMFTINGVVTLNGQPYTAQRDDIWLANSTLSHQAGTHLLKIGVEYRRYITDGVSAAKGTQNGSYTSDGNLAVSQSTGKASSQGNQIPFAVAELEMGMLSSGSQTQVADSLTRMTYWAAFVHDDWRATNKLTLNLGLRWELETPNTELNGKDVAYFDFNSSNDVTAKGAANYLTVASGMPTFENSVGPLTSINPNGGLVFANTKGNGLAPYATNKLSMNPRIGFAFAPNEKLAIRGGYGIFFDSVGMYFVALPYIPQNGYTQATSITAPAYATSDTGLAAITSTLNDPFGNFANQTPGSLTPITGNSAGLDTAIGQNTTLQTYNQHTPQPYNQRWSLGIQKQIGGFIASVDYVGSKATHLYTTNQQDLNAIPRQYLSSVKGGFDQYENFALGTTTLANPFLNVGSSTYNALYSTKTLSVGQLVRPRPEFYTINGSPMNGSANYNSVQVSVNRRFTRGFSTTQSFTYSKQMDATQFLNTGDATPWYGLSAYDRPLRYSMSVIYQLPWGRGRRWLSSSHGVVAQIVGGWQLNGLYQNQSGKPFSFGNSVYTGPGSPGDSAWSRSSYKNSRVFNSGGSGTSQAGLWFNPSNWLLVSKFPMPPGMTQTTQNTIATCPFTNGATSTYICPTGEPGSLQYNSFAPRYGTLRADRFIKADAGIQRQFQIGELGTLQFRAEAHNLFNRPTYSAPATDPTKTTFGQITGADFSGRIYQFAAFVRF
jgi:hypothetical protein